MTLLIVALLTGMTAAIVGFAFGRRRERARCAISAETGRCRRCGDRISQPSATSGPAAWGIPQRSIAGKSHKEVEALLGPPTMELITNQGLQVSYCDGELTVLYVDGAATWFLVPPAPREHAYREVTTRSGTGMDSRAPRDTRRGFPA